MSTPFDGRRDPPRRPPLLVTQIARRLRAEFAALEQDDLPDTAGWPNPTSPPAHVRQIIDRLAVEFAPSFDRATVAHHVDAALDDLNSGERPGGWPAGVVEQFARDRLRAWRRRQEGDQRRPAVLFLGRHGARRAPMAAGWMRSLAGERVEVFTGGTQPSPLVDLTATAAMAEVGIDIGGELPQPSPAEVLGAVDLVVVMGEGVAQAVDLGELAPATAVQIWPLAEASELPLDDLRTLRDDIGRRIAALVARLPPVPS